MWEAINDDKNPADSWYRIRSGLHFGDVMAVKANGISQNTPTEALELLSMSANVTTDSEAEIQLNFAGGGALLLKAECINITLTDTGDAWQTEHKPQHEETNSPSDQDKE